MKFGGLLRKNAAAALSACLVLAACGGGGASSGGAGGRGETPSRGAGAGASAGGVSVAVQTCANPESIDPAINTAADASTVVDALFQGLMTFGEDKSVVPGTAQSYDLSEDGRTYTFHIRPEAKWSDGKPVTAGDFLYAWNRLVAPETGAPYASIIDIVDGFDEGKLNISAPDDATFIVKLKAPAPYFAELCTHNATFPVRQDCVESNPEGWTLSPETCVGNGPFALKEWRQQGYIQTEKNPYYWAADGVKIDDLRFALMADDNAALAAFRQGELSFIKSVPMDELDALKSTPEYHGDPLLGNYYVTFNTQKIPMPVRKALTLAIDREYLVEQVGKTGQRPAGAIVPPEVKDADGSDFREKGGDYFDVKDYAGNLELAKKTLEDAGYKDGAGLPEYTFTYNEGTMYEQTALALQDMWAKIGVKVTLQQQDWATFLGARRAGDYEIARSGWYNDFSDPVTCLDIFCTDNGNNDWQWSNPEFDKLIAQVKSTGDNAERMRLLHQAEDLVMADWCVAPMFYYTDLYLQSEKLKGVTMVPLSYRLFDRAYIEE
ncbi:MAG: peptide ABC transporter substrate-binding protein [Clostridiales bacterium]|jgi:oligopeptide transport system substrate-binding protein|nr:peptide ABC transporter substrate-binding protein [Clostridiales bacterium]